MNERVADQAALRGNPSFAWRAGQERRLALVHRYVPLDYRRVLDVGCGVGMYMQAFMRFTPWVWGVEVEYERARAAYRRGGRVALGMGESLPFADGSFDVAFSHEVLEHTQDDGACAAEMVRVVKPGGYLVVFVPNRGYPFETHGIYWRGQYHFGNKLLVNWLPDVLRHRLAPHVRVYTSGDLRRLFTHQPVRVVVHTQIFAGYDNIVARYPRLGNALRRVTYALERTPLRMLGLSHFLVLQVVSSGDTLRAHE